MKKQNKSLAAALDAALGTKTANFVKNYSMTPKRFAEAVGKPRKLANAILEPAYGRLCITPAHVMDWFNRGFDFEIVEPHFHSRYANIRDFAPGAQIQFRYGKRLQKTFTHTV